MTAYFKGVKYKVLCCHTRLGERMKQRIMLLGTILLALFSFSAMAGNVVSINVGVHESKTVSLPSAMGYVVIGDRSIATVVKHASRKISVTGQKLGKTDIRIMNGKRIVTEINVNVTPNLTAIKKSLHKLFPKNTIGVELANGSVVLTGEVEDTSTAAHVVSVVEEYVGDGNSASNILNFMKLSSGQQVMLKVRVGEVRKEVLSRLGLGVHGILSGSALIGALDREKAWRILAEPTLTAISGQSADFLAGGEFPVPVAQSGNLMSVDYKPFGVNVAFTPLVLSENRIRLNVSSEVSEISEKGAVTLNNIKIPAVATRRANTTVELAPGESFVIAGLLRNDSLAQMHQVPGLGDIPVLNALFRSAQFKNNESELVIAVTPYVVNPAAASDIVLPTDRESNIRSAADLMFGRLIGKNTNKLESVKESGAEGGFGFVLDE